MRPIQVVITQDARGAVSVAVNPAAQPTPLEMLGLLSVAHASVLDSMRHPPERPGVEIVTGPAAQAIARESRDTGRR